MLGADILYVAIQIKCIVCLGLLVERKSNSCLSSEENDICHRACKLHNFITLEFVTHYGFLGCFLRFGTMFRILLCDMF